MFFFVEVKSAGKEFDFVPEEIEGDTAREISEVLELHFAEGNRLFRTIENDAAGVGRGFVEEGDEDINCDDDDDGESENEDDVL